VDERTGGDGTATSRRSGAKGRPKLPDAPEADVQEQQQDWADHEERQRPRVPPDAPEADVLDQATPAQLDDDDREHEG
jgi:hypothetical protein